MIGAFNFGNIRTNPANAWQGKTTQHGAAFESFDAPENGVRAIAKLLQTYGTSGADTLEGILSRYSPPNENSTPSLIQAAARRTGYAPGQRLDLSDPAVLDTVTRAIIQQEVGNAGPAGDVIQRGVKAALPVPTRNVSMLPTPQPAQENNGMASRGSLFGLAQGDMRDLSSTNVMPGNSLTGLLQVDEDKNFYDGLGGLLGKGQTPSQPPGPSLLQSGGMPPIGSQAELMAATLPAQRPAVDWQALLTGAASGAAGVPAGAGIGQMLAGAAGGVMQGQRQQRADQLAEREAQSQAALRAAQAQHYGRAQGSDPKVVGKWIYENGQWKAPPGQADAGGPFEGTAENVQMYNQLIMLEQKRANGTPLSPQETYTLDLIKRNLTAPKQTVNGAGQAVEETPPPLPQWGGQQATQGPAPMQAAPLPNANGTQATQTTVLPSGAKVTTVGDKTPTNEQNLNASYANRLNSANSTFDTLEVKGHTTPGLYDRAVENVPVLGNYLTSDEHKSMEQAQREFITAQLRRESGAAISESEFETARKLYFPQPGDPPGIIAQKRRSREMAVGNMAQSAGPAKLGFTPRKVDEPGGADPLGIR
jgi:hypothetical protein